MKYILTHHVLIFAKAGLTNFLVSFFLFDGPLEIFLSTLITCAIYFGIYVALYFIKKDFFYWDRFEAALIQDSIILALIYIVFIVHIAFTVHQLIVIGIGVGVSCIAPIAVLAFA
jgi:hypothetical protein